MTYSTNPALSVGISPLTPSELEIITLHSFQVQEAAMAQQGGGTDISQAPSARLLTSFRTARP